MSAVKLYMALDEVLQFAMAIEENGVQFYLMAEKYARSQKLKELFAFLAKEEANHQETFKCLGDKFDISQPRGDFPDEYFALLRKMVDIEVFLPIKEKDFVKKFTNQIQVIDFAIQRELDAILFYMKMKKMIPEKDHRVVEEIIDEERTHYNKLTAVKSILHK